MDPNKKNDELVKVNEDEMDNVAGGAFFFGKDHDDGFEINCAFAWHSENECKKSPDGYHYWIEGKGTAHQCKYCNKPSAW